MHIVDRYDISFFKFKYSIWIVQHNFYKRNMSKDQILYIFLRKFKYVKVYLIQKF